MALAAKTLDGWYAFHDVRYLDREGWEAVEPREREDILQEANSFLTHCEDVADAEEGGSAFFKVLGHKGDLMLFHLRPTLDHLHGLEEGFEELKLARYLTPSSSFLSIVELGQHSDEEDEDEGQEEAELSEWVMSRLKPELPQDMPYICFYPMNKRRGEEVNWFNLPAAERQELMMEHGLTGRKYAGKVKQIITGAMGLDDWEWGVTLFAYDPLQFKKLVYEMRFDRVSALYAEVGPFYVGSRVRPEELKAFLG